MKPLLTLVLVPLWLLSAHCTAAAEPGKRAKSAPPHTTAASAAASATASLLARQAAASKLVEKLSQKSGPEAADTLRARFQLAEITSALSHDSGPETEQQLRSLLPLLARVLGAEQRETLACHADLCLVLAHSSRYTAAARECRALIPIATRALGAADPVTLRARRALARTLAEQLKMEEAHTETLQIAETARRALSPEHPEALQARLASASLDILMEKSDLAAIISQLKALLPLLSRVLGPEHRATLQCQAALALGDKTRQDADTSGEVEDQLRAALETQTRVLGPEAPDTLMPLLFLTAVLDRPDSLDEAEKEGRRLIQAQEHALGPDDGAPMLRSLNSLLITLKRQKKYPEAAQLLRTRATLATQVVGPEAPETLHTRVGLADMLEDQDENTEAEAIRRAVLAIQERTLGAENPETLVNRFNLAWNLRSQKKYPEALAAAQQVLEARRRSPGPEHSSTTAAQHLVNELTYIVAPHTLRTRTSADGISPPAAPHDHPIVMVDGAIIMESELTAAIKAQEDTARYEHPDAGQKLAQELARIRRETIDTLVKNQLLLNRFDSIGGILKPSYVEDDIQSIIKDKFHGDTAAFKAELAKDGMPEREFRRMRERMMILNVMRARLAGDVSAEENEVRRYFEKNKKRWAAPGMVKIRTLSIPRYDTGRSEAESRTLAENLRTKIAGGADFAPHALHHSQDSHAENGGEWDWMKASDLSEDLRDAISDMKKGGLSPVIESSSTFIIFRLDDLRPGPEPKYEQHREEARSLLESEMRKERVDKKIEELRHRAEIQYLDAV